MSKLLGGLLLGVTTFALCGSVVAAEQTRVRPNDSAAHAAAGPAGAIDDANRSSANARANAGADADVGRSPEYNAALQKCDAMTGAAKTRCAMAAEKKHSAADRADGNAAGNQAYSADLQKCDAMSPAEKTHCVSVAKRKHGHM